MKKMNFMFTSIVLSALIVGCGGGSSSSNTANQSSPVEKKEEQSNAKSSSNTGNQSSTVEKVEKKEDQTGVKSSLSAEEIVKQLNTKSSFTIEYTQKGHLNTNYKNSVEYVPNLNTFYKYKNGDEKKYPNSEEPNINISFEKVNNNEFTRSNNNEVGDKYKILSMKKVDKILGVSVNTTEIKVFATEVESEWEVEKNYSSNSYNSIEDFKDYLMTGHIGENSENNSLKEDGKVYDKTGNLIEASSWKIENNILKINYYDKVWYKIKDGKVMELWKGDTGFIYIDITKQQLDVILNKLNSAS